MATVHYPFAAPQNCTNLTVLYFSTEKFPGPVTQPVGCLCFYDDVTDILFLAETADAHVDSAIAAHENELPL
jgi:hypothetical protein